jgi:hypothetical protein
MLPDMDEEEAVNFAISKVKEAITDTQKTRRRVSASKDQSTVLKTLYST